QEAVGDLTETGVTRRLVRVRRLRVLVDDRVERVLDSLVALRGQVVDRLSSDEAHRSIVDSVEVLDELVAALRIAKHADHVSGLDGAELVLLLLVDALFDGLEVTGDL